MSTCLVCGADDDLTDRGYGIVCRDAIACASRWLATRKQLRTRIRRLDPETRVEVRSE